MADRNGGKTIFGKKYKYTVHIPSGVKNFAENTLCSVLENNVFLRFMQKFKIVTKKWREYSFGKVWQMTAGTPGVEIALSNTVSEIFEIFYLHC